MAGTFFSCGKTENTIGFACPSHKNTATGNWTGSLDEYLKLARGDVLFRHTEKASPSCSCICACIFHSDMLRRPTWVFQLETRALCVARPLRFDYSGCLFSRVKAAGLAWSHECFRQQAPSCSTC